MFKYFLSAFTLLILNLNIFSEIPNFDSSEVINIPSNNILQEYISPLQIDWNSDGLMDLLVGDLKRSLNDSGTLVLFLNIGTTETYKFDTGHVLLDNKNQIIKASAN